MLKKINKINAYKYIYIYLYLSIRVYVLDKSMEREILCNIICAESIKKM